MKKFLLLAVPLGILIFTGCHGFGFGCHGMGVRGSGVSKDETRNVDNFNSIDIGGAFDVDITVGGSPSVQISGDDNILPLVRTEVEGNTLHVYTKKSISPKKKLRLRITTESLEQVDESGACDIRVSQVNTDRLVLNISGASKLRVAGKAGELQMELSGAGKVDAHDLITQTADVEISGASKAEVYATENLRADISGVGNLDYYGNPKKVKQSVSGVGSITQR